MARSIETVKRDILKIYDNTKSWRATGKVYGISAAMALLIAHNGYEPKTPAIRHKLGMTPMVEVAACPVCGEGHQRKTCPKYDKQGNAIVYKIRFRPYRAGCRTIEKVRVTE